MILTPLGMDTNGEKRIAQPSDMLGLNTFYSNTATATLTNTTSNVSLLPTGTSTHTIGANSATSGQTFLLEGNGVYSTPALSSSITLSLIIGSTTLCSVTTTALLNSATNNGFDFDGWIKILNASNMSAVTVIAGAIIAYKVSSISPAQDWLTQTSVATIDMTTDQVLDLKGQWDAATTSRSATVQTATIMRWW